MRRSLVLVPAALVLIATASPALAHGKGEPRKHRVIHRRDKVVRVARNHLGVPYVWGGASWSGYDCSGYSLLVYRQALGIQLAHSSIAQAQAGGRPGWKRIWKIKNIKRGDLVLYANTYRPGISHTGIALNRKRTAMAHGFGSRSSATPWSFYYRSHFAFAVRPKALVVR